MQFQVGELHTLKVIHKTKNGFHLSNGSNETILPFFEITDPINKGDEITVFFYLNKDGKIAPTMKIPFVSFDQFGWADVVDRVDNLGVFVNIGTAKEVLVSKDDLPLKENVWPVAGDQLFVKLGLDKKGRLLALPAGEYDIVKQMTHAEKKIIHHEVNGRVYRSTKIGTFVLTEEGYRGFIHYTERKEEPRLGEYVEGRIIGVKDDGTINISLRSEKVPAMDEDANRILTYLQENEGEMPFGDKSDANTIRETFKISKSAFKRALGKLMKEKKIEQKNGKTFLK